MFILLINWAAPPPLTKDKNCCVYSADGSKRKKKLKLSLTYVNQKFNELYRVSEKNLKAELISLIHIFLSVYCNLPVSLFNVHN